ncbi:MAG: hypothetical protein ACRDUA_20065 [Micromonosporaceae bacterium]
MSTVVIALERGFRRHHVTVAINGEEVLNATNVTTDPGVGIAGSVAVDTGSHCRVKVALPERGVAADLELTVSELTYLRISLSDDTLILTPVVEGPGAV